MEAMTLNREDYVTGKLIRFRCSGARHTLVGGRDTLGSNWVIDWTKEKVLVLIGTTGLIVDVPFPWKGSLSGNCVVFVEEHVVLATYSELELFSNP